MVSNTHTHTHILPPSRCLPVGWAQLLGTQLRLLLRITPLSGQVGSCLAHHPQPRFAEAFRRRPPSCRLQPRREAARLSGAGHTIKEQSPGGLKPRNYGSDDSDETYCTLLTEFIICKKCKINLWLRWRYKNIIGLGGNIILPPVHIPHHI